MKINPLTCMDFYKADHRRQYPEGTEYVYSNFTPRSAKLANVLPDFDNKIVWFGLQGFIKHFLIDTWNQEFFDKPREEVVKAYKRRMDTSLGPDSIPAEHIEALHDLGYLPVCIAALPEGERVNIGVPPLTIFNTQPEFFWLVNYLETVMSSELWKACTNATIASEYKRLLLQFAEKTDAPLDFVPFQGHDFSARGMSGLYDAAQSGVGHLLSFVGTDTVSAIDYAENYYNADAEKELIGCSVPATEHSVMCMGEQEKEIDTFRRLITQLYPTGVVSIVSDTWDFWKVICEYAKELKPEIMARQPNALGLNKVVFRPDSGDPVEIICGSEIVLSYGSLQEAEESLLEDVDADCQENCGQGFHGPDTVVRTARVDGKLYKLTFDVEYEGQWQDRGDKLYSCEKVRLVKTEETELSPEQKGAVECLWDIFGGTITDKGYKVLDQHVGIIYGDSITLERAKAILERLEEKGFASNNIVFGIGSYTYQHSTRDTFGWAMKATWGQVNGQSREIFKDPKTGDGVKKSAKGLLRVEKVGKDYILYDQQPPNSGGQPCALETIFYDGVLWEETSLSEIRERLSASL